MPVAAGAIAQETLADFQLQGRGHRWISSKNTAQRDHSGLLGRYFRSWTRKHLPLVLSPPCYLCKRSAAECIKVGHDGGLRRNSKQPFVVKPSPNGLGHRVPLARHVG